MLARPTTEQLLLDCARELMEGVLPSLADETAQVRVVMLDSVLRSMAVRAAHEIAWMTEETADIEAYVAEVAAAAPELAVPPAPGTGAALHLDDVVERYCRAGRWFSAALEAAVHGSHAGLVARGEELLGRRAAHEREAMAGWSPTGR